MSETQVMANFTGILDGDGDTWGVRIPDLPGCHGGGATADEAVSDAIAAALEWIEHQVTAGVAIPAPRTFTEVIRDPATEFDPTCEVAVLVPVIFDAGRRP